MDTAGVMDKAHVSGRMARERATKPRNSDVRKQQNRVASRAYREKRKQKLALLDQILKTESRESSSSLSEPDDAQESLQVMHSRNSSRSPALTPQPATPAAATIWHSPGQTGASIDNFGGEPFDDLWMNGFQRSNDMFDVGPDFANGFHTSSVGNPSLGITHQFLPTIPSMAPLSSMQSIPLDPPIPETHVSSYHTHPAGTPGPSHRSSSLYDESSFSSSHEPPILTALEAFSKLNISQQQQLLEVIYRSRSLSPSLGTDRAWDMRVNCPVPPTPDEFDPHNVQQLRSVRNDSRSPAPSRHH